MRGWGTGGRDRPARLLLWRTDNPARRLGSFERSTMTDETSTDRIAPPPLRCLGDQGSVAVSVKAPLANPT